MLALIRTLVDITLLRRGPDEIPHSWILLYMCISLWLLALLATAALIANFDAMDAWISLGSLLVGSISYVIVISATGHGSRTVQTLAALIGCGAIISFVMLAELVLFTPFFGRELATFIAFVVLVWSVPVKGHIIARAINWHWYAGIVIAFTVFLLQLAFTQFMSPES